MMDTKKCPLRSEKIFMKSRRDDEFIRKHIFNILRNKLGIATMS